MKKYIVTTTIQSPTEATLKFSNKEDWTLVVVGDLKTPHNEYKKINCVYLSPEDQQKLYPSLSDSIGWNSIQRRNIGFVYAYQNGAEIIATVDDDNIPYETWGKNLLVESEVEVDVYKSESLIFDPLSVTEHNWLWHRGFPIEDITIKNKVELVGRKKVFVDVQADLWDGDPDIDAINRLTKKPIVKFNNINPYTSQNKVVFNSQNTFLSRRVIKDYMVFPNVGRMDDIWGAYYLQKVNKNTCVVFSKPSVYQERNKQDLITNLEKEIIGYRNTKNYILGNYDLPEKTINFIKEYKKAFR